MMEDDLDKMARQLKAKWGAEKSAPKAFGDEQQERYARNLVGRDNLNRLDRSRSGKPFRPAPVRVHFEYWWHDGGQFSRGGWSIVRIENGRQEDYRWEGDHDLMTEVKRLRKQGFTVREIHMGLVPRRKDQKPESKRKSILASIGRIKR